jgi:hypothetical protein
VSSPEVIRRPQVTGRHSTGSPAVAAGFRVGPILRGNVVSPSAGGHYRPRAPAQTKPAVPEDGSVLIAAHGFDATDVRPTLDSTTAAG